MNIKIITFIAFFIVALLFSCNQGIDDKMNELSLLESGEFPREYYDLLYKYDLLNLKYDSLIKESKKDKADILQNEILKIENEMIKMGGGPIQGLKLDKGIIIDDNVIY